jgi:hypothetical protein
MDKHRVNESSNDVGVERHDEETRKISSGPGGPTPEASVPRRGVRRGCDVLELAGLVRGHSRRQQTGQEPALLPPIAENDQSYYVAYVSEQNLVPDDTGEPVDHPDLPDLFGDFEDGYYPLQVQLN